jgi:hypothetical protein
VHHLGDVSRDHVLEVDGLLVAAPARAVVDTARTVPFEAGVVLADGARRLLRPEMDEVMDVLECQRDWAGSIMASRVVKFSDGRAATVGESRGRVMIARLGLPAPDLQRRIEGSRGELIAITDYYFDGLDTAAEFDGRQKYGRELYEQSNRHDEDVDLGDVVWREKRARTLCGTKVMRWSAQCGSSSTVTIVPCDSASCEPSRGLASVRASPEAGHTPPAWPRQRRSRVDRALHATVDPS